jgi:multiple sugar transport system substrate-binding protein
MMRNKKRFAVAASLIAVPLVLASCASGGDTTAPVASEAPAELSGVVTYGLWDSNQLPAYEECAANFEAANPGVDVQIEQLGWGDYWEKVRAGMVSGDGYDVFTSHLAFYPEFVANGQVYAIDDFVARDGFDVNQYQPGLADLWTNPEGQRFGLPKDFDTIALFANKKMLEAAGLSETDIYELDWNPTDGGSYEQAIAHLTVDKNGVRGDEAGFDKNNVDVYGIWMEGSGGGDGQTQWSFLAAANGWKVNDGPWNSNYHYDDPKFQETIDWWYSLVEKGYMPSFDIQNGVGWADQMIAGKVALSSNGSWMTGYMFSQANDVFEPTLVPTPIGPTGQRASMYNGLADNIYAGTKNPEAAWAWVKYMGTTDCQDVVASYAVVFPAIPSSTEKAVAAMAEKGIDVNPFYVHITDGTTFLFPIADKKSQVSDLITPAMDAVMSGKEPASSLSAVNDQILALFN